MGHPPKTIAAIAAGLAGVLGMAGVAAAAHGSDNAATHASSTTTSSHHQRRNDATSTTVALPGATTTSEPEHVRPEPGDDHGNDANDNEANDNDEATTTTFPGDTTTSMPEETTTSMPGIPNGMQSFTVAGGTVTVDIENGVLSLVTVTPNPGVSVKDQRAESDRVEVEFRGPDGDSRVRVRTDEGQLRIETGDN